MQVYNSLTLSNVGNSPVVVPFNSPSITVGQLVGQPITSLGLMCTLTAGASLTYSVQITGDNPQNIIYWNNHDILANLTTSKSSNILYPVSGIRLVVTVWAAGSVNLGIVQWP